MPPPYKYEGPREEGASLEISVTIEPEEGAEEGAEKKVRTKTITLLGARKGPGGKAAYPNGDAFEGSYFAGKRHGATGSYTHTRHVAKELARPSAAWLSEACCSAGYVMHRPPHVSPCLCRYAAQPPPPAGSIAPRESTRARGRRVRRRRVRVRVGSWNRDRTLTRREVGAGRDGVRQGRQVPRHRTLTLTPTLIKPNPYPSPYPKTVNPNLT